MEKKILNIFWIILLLMNIPLSLAFSMQKIGQSIRLPFPNDQTILGVGGLTYDKDTNIWTASSENIPGSIVSEKYPISSIPRIYHMMLDFQTGSIVFVNNEGPILINPMEGLKIEDIAMASKTFGNDSNEKEFWLVSEANSHLVKTSTFFSKDFGAPDLSTYDPDTFVTSRLVRVDGNTGVILEEAHIPDFAQWDQHHDWDGTKCLGDRPFQGLHALTITPSSEEGKYDDLMYVGIQSALYQDGPTPNDFQGSATRILVYGLDYNNSLSSSTAKFLKSYRYDTSQLTLESYQKGARHFNALFSILAINETSLIVGECEDFFGFAIEGHKVVNRLFYVELDEKKTVDHCASLLECDVPAPVKRLIWEQNDDKQLDGIAWGPVLKDSSNQSYPTLALTFEDDANFGVHFELFTFNLEELLSAEVWLGADSTDYLLKNRIIAVSISVTIVVVLVVVQALGMRHISLHSKPKSVITSKLSTTQGRHRVSISTRPCIEQLDKGNKSRMWTFSNYALLSAMLNSFLVGGITFGFSGMLLILRKEGTYAESCACGSFCSKEKEQLAFISTIGFAIAIGSRLFIGMFLDSQGPKCTALMCSMVSFSGVLLLAVNPKENLRDIFMPAWVLLSLGGSGLHLSGFHFTNLFKEDGKKTASAAISAAFGASSAVFPIMQVFNQYAGVHLQDMAIFYAVIVFFIGVNNFLIQPWKKVQPGIPFKPEFKVWRPTWWKRGLKNKPLLASALVQAARFEMLGETLCYSMSLLLLTHFLSTSAQLMYEKGDKPFTSNPNDWTDYMIARMAGWFNSLGFLWFPLVQIMVTNLRWSSSYLILLLVNISIVVIILVTSLELQILGFLLLSMARLMLFSFHHGYILDTFGIEHFGTLNGISSLIAAMVGLLSYPLQLFALSTSFSISFIPIGLGIILSFVFPFIIRRRPLLNWAETVAFEPHKFRYPQNLNEVVALVKSPHKIRCAGAMHSCAPLIVSEGIILSLDHLNQILEIDVKRMTVKAQAGVKVHELCEALAPHGLAMGTLGTVDWQTIAGAVMTGTHGGSLTVQSMHTFINSYKLVKPDGNLITVNKESDPVLFSAMAPSMGVFGVVIEVEVQCVPLEYLEARMEAISFDDLILKFENIMKTNKYARVVVYSSIMKATVWTANPVNRGEAVARGATRSNGYINFRDENEKAWLEQFLLHCNRKSYEKADNLLHKVLNSQLKRLHHYEGQYNHVLCKERNNGIPHADIEFNFDFMKNKEVLEAVKKYCMSKRIPYYNFECRTTQRDDAMLSCCYGRDSMWIDFQAKNSVSRQFFGEIEAVLKPIGFRKHWAKGMDNTDPKYVLSQFPKAGQFIKLMEAFDPDGKFRNQEGNSWYRMMSMELGNQDVNNLKNTEEGCYYNNNAYDYKTHM